MITDTTQSTVDQIALSLARAHHPLLVLGWGAVVAGASSPVAALATRLPQLRVVATPKAKGVFSEFSRQYLGVVGFAGHETANQFLFERADYVVVIGSRLGELTSNNWDTRWRHLNMARVDVSEGVLRSWCPSHQTVVGDARGVLERVLRALGPQNTAKGRATESHVSTDSRVSTVSRATPANDVELDPVGVFGVINRHFPAEGHVFSGIGNSMAWGVHYLTRSVANRWHVNLSAGAMGHAIPAAIGAALTGAESLAVVGDAEFLMTGYELHTAVENSVRLTVIVLNDSGHGMVRIGSRVHCKNRTPSFDFNHPVNIVAASQAQGARALTVRTPKALREVLRERSADSGPIVIEVPISRELSPPLGARLESLTQSFGTAQNGAEQ